MKGLKIVPWLAAIYFLAALSFFWVADLWVSEGEFMSSFWFRLFLYAVLISFLLTVVSLVIHEIGYRRGEGKLRQYLKETGKDKKECTEILDKIEKSVDHVLEKEKILKEAKNE